NGSGSSGAGSRARPRVGRDRGNGALIWRSGARLHDFRRARRALDAAPRPERQRRRGHGHGEQRGPGGGQKRTPTAARKAVALSSETGGCPPTLGLLRPPSGKRMPACTWAKKPSSVSYWMPPSNSTPRLGSTLARLLGSTAAGTELA